MAEGLEKDFESLLLMAIEVKHDNTDEFMKYFKGRVDGFASKYFDSAGRKLDMTEPGRCRCDSPNVVKRGGLWRCDRCGKLYTGKIEKAPSDDMQEGTIPLASGLHSDGTIHIYVHEKDSGLSVGRLEDGTLIVKVDESKGVMVAGSSI